MPDVHVSYSQIASFRSCPKRWSYSHLENLRPKRESAPLTLGRLVHAALDAWWRDEDWGAAIVAAAAEAEAPSLESIETARWLMGRYEQFYAHTRPHFRLIESEQEWRVWFRGVWLVARVDKLIEHGGQLWIVEHKTVSDWRRAEYAHVDPQVAIYQYVAVEVYQRPVAGVLFDYLRTYRWKDDRPLHESFRRELVGFGDQQLGTMIEDAATTIGQIVAAHNGARTPRHLGWGCLQCPYQRLCWGELLGLDGALLRSSEFTRADGPAAS